ncbi:hypothetical protein FQN60_009243 [Etheostoma spectabile]|uniref:RNA helicase n=1 Tax=Etheostoma spectabile TaxID=54343 RepID=A0A5J5CD29_9PERO|nr:hypothetical protein FQN60_009243 [Etheostoma spectabile]
MEKPDVVVGTPSRVLAHLNAHNLLLQSSLETLVVVLKLQGSQLPDSSQLQQYSIKCEEEDKFLLVYTLLKLRLVQGKTLVFVGAVERCYRLKLFLEQFGIPACVLNSELPVQSRTKDKEYGVSRGVDFQSVANVINFDFPTAVESYVHRVGRTARADNPGTALSFVSHTELALLSEDAMRSVTKQAVREARLKEIKQELLNSEKLKTYFEDNPRDLQLLRHDKDLHPAVVKPHLRNPEEEEEEGKTRRRRQGQVQEHPGEEPAEELPVQRSEEREGQSGPLIAAGHQDGHLSPILELCRDTFHHEDNVNAMSPAMSRMDEASKTRH